MTEHNITDEMVMALADGELPPHEAEAVQAAIDKEPRLQQLYDDMIYTGKFLKKAFGDLSEDAAYDKLVQQIRTEGAAPQDLRPKPENVVWLNFKKFKIEFSEMRRMAASLVIGLFLGGISWQAYMTTAVPTDVATKPLVFRGGPSELQEKAFPAADEKLPAIAPLYDKEGRYGEVEKLYKRALDINEKALDPWHPDVADSLNNLALLYTQQGRYDEAEPLYKRSLAIREKTLGPEHPDVATSLNNLARLYTKQGRYGEAEKLFERVLPIITETLKKNSPTRE